MQPTTGVPEKTIELDNTIIYYMHDSKNIPQAFV